MVTRDITRTLFRPIEKSPHIMMKIMRTALIFMYFPVSNIVSIEKRPVPIFHASSGQQAYLFSLPLFIHHLETQ